MQSEDEDNSNEEEWQEIQKKFVSEGINFSIPSRKKALYLWRWLGDSENNLKTSRKMLEKLRLQQSEEMKEVEKYVEHIKHVSSTTIEQLESENSVLKHTQDEHDSVDKISREVSEMLAREGLSEIINLNLAEQVAYLLVLRSRLTEDLETERNKMALTSDNLTDNLKLTSTKCQQMLEEQKTDFEEELRHERELTKKVKEELKRTHDAEIIQMQTKLTSAQKRVDELEGRLHPQNNSYTSAKEDANNEHDVLDVGKLREKLALAEERLKKLEYMKRQLENDNESLSFKVSELLMECEEKEAQLRRERMKKAGAKPVSQEYSTLESSTQRHENNVDNKNNSHLEQPWVQQINKLHQDIENLQEQLLSVGGRHDALSLRYQQRKAEGRTKMQKIRGVFQAKQTSFKDQITELECALKVLRTSLSWEKECRQKIQSDFASLQNEKKEMMIRLLESEEGLQEKSIQLKSLNIRVDNLEKENSRVSEEMALLKKLVMQEVMGSSSQSMQLKESKKRTPVWLKKTPDSSRGHNKLALLERMLIPASEHQEEVTV